MPHLRKDPEPTRYRECTADEENKRWHRRWKSNPATLVIVRIQRQVVDYALRRRSLLADVYAGRVGVAEVCDANPYLLRAAKFHGRGSEVTCPICRKEQLTLVSWVFGDGLGQAAGSARTPDELTRMAESNEEFSVHVVEVCRSCSWNHLVQSYVLGSAPAPARRRAGPRAGRRSAAE
ncbi:hypothetical protein FNL39_101834 [Nocardia caishijiensis]|uniref:DUF5318 domain-containing protein n=1 Tax=Nocardia caishijiensis TaxID=184756 RepID=A0ABQ6YV03_9NOCA|nr:hypothetical protein FNL39_101834 [Nocardia caishijiensis]